MDDTLLLLANEVRGKTLWLLDGVTDEMARFAAPGLANSILWHAGHALVVVEHLAVAPARGRSPELHDEANHQGEMWLLRKMHAQAGRRSSP